MQLVNIVNRVRYSQMCTTREFAGSTLLDYLMCEIYDV